MGLVKRILIVMVVLMAWFGVSSGVLYTVGDIHGWSNHSNVNYKTWASSKQFHIGDFIRFKYDRRVDNVVRVTHKNFRACNAKNSIHVTNSGEDIVAVRNPHSHLYFISSARGHCKAGQKVDIRLYRPPYHFSGGSSGGAPSESAAHRSLYQPTVAVLLLSVLLAR